MTVDERKMAIAYGDLLNMQELVQHILRMDADELFRPEAKKAFAQIAVQLDTVMADVGQYVSRHTEFNEVMSFGSFQPEYEKEVKASIDLKLDGCTKKDGYVLPNQKDAGSSRLL